MFERLRGSGRGYASAAYCGDGPGHQFVTPSYSARRDGDLLLR